MALYSSNLFIIFLKSQWQGMVKIDKGLYILKFLKISVIYGHDTSFSFFCYAPFFYRNGKNNGTSGQTTLATIVNSLSENHSQIDNEDRKESM